MSPSHNRYLIIIILGALSTITPFAIDMYLPAVSGHGCGIAHVHGANLFCLLPVILPGWLSGNFFMGRCWIVMAGGYRCDAGLLLFIAASMLCLISHDVKWLIAMRCLQALGGCAAQVAAMSMVRDFFHVNETAKIISLLILIISVSPFLAPRVGYYVTGHWGWQFVFVVLAAFAFLMLLVAKWCLPEGHKADRSISLRPGPILRNYAEVLREPQFITYALAGAFWRSQVCSFMYRVRPSSFSWRSFTWMAENSAIFLRDWPWASSEPNPG